MVTIGKGKHFSLGIDLEGLISLSALEIMEFSDGLQKLLGRILTFPLVTVAAINGIHNIDLNKFIIPSSTKGT